MLKVSVLICKKTIKSQKEDEKCCEIVHTIEHGGNCGNFVFANGLLYKETGGDKRIYVPRSMEVVASSNIALKGVVRSKRNGGRKSVEPDTRLYAHGTHAVM